MSTVRTLLAQARASLGGDQDAASEAQILLCHVLDKPRTWLLGWPEHSVGADLATRYRELIAQRRQGMPVAYLTGRREFWTLELVVNRHTLIPRPETELLVERALHLLPPQAPRKVLELGTGSGAIALALACERPHWSITATDISGDSLQVARLNARRHGIENVDFLESDWFDSVQGDFDLVLSNPPYIPDQDPHLQQGDPRYEPRHALASGPRGLDAIGLIVENAPTHLRRGGWLVFEHGFDQGPACRDLLSRGGYTGVFSERDLGGHERISGAQLPLDPRGIKAED